MVETGVTYNSSNSGVEELKKQPLFRDLQCDSEEPEITEMESLCMKCEEMGTTRLLLTRIPFFKEIILMSFECPHCFHKDTSIQPGGTIQEKGVRIKLKVQDKSMMNRQIVKQDSASYKIEEINFEAPAFTSKGVLTTVEGLLSTAVEGLDQEQPVRRIMQPEIAAKIDDIMNILKEYKEGKNPFTLILEDVSGNSYIENPHAPDPDPHASIEHFQRTKEENISLGIYEENEVEGLNLVLLINVFLTKKAFNALKSPKHEEATFPQDEKGEEQFHDEVLEFPSNCPSCQSPVVTKMKQINIPHFKEVIIMACNCDVCGYKSNDVKAGGAIEEKGQRLTLRMTDKADLTRDILTSETCAVNIPDLELELAHSSLGGKFTTLEGLLMNFKEQLGVISPFAFGDSATKKNKMKDLLEKLDKIIAGELFVAIILDDPVGNSFIQNLYAPDPDPELTVEKYERTEEQNQDLGLTDMNTDYYR